MKKSKLRNPVFWLGMLSVILLAANIDPQTLTTWAIVKESFWTIINNPYTLIMVLVACYSQFNDNGVAKLDIPFKKK